MIKLSFVNSETEMSELQDALVAEPEGSNIGPFVVGNYLLNDECGLSALAIRDGGGALVGHAICHAMESDDGSVMEISKLYIHKSQRSNGYANQAVDEIVSLAKNEGIGEIFVEPIDENAAKFWNTTDFEYDAAINRYVKKLDDN